MFVMAPTLERIYDGAVKPWMESEAAIREAAVSESPAATANPPFTIQDAWTVASKELAAFMLHNTRRDDLALFLQMANHPVPSDESLMEIPLHIIVPSFVVSELKTAFIMGFCIYIPFLLVDLVVSTLLMSLGMMMMTPATVSTPCKLLLFVLVDGWHLISRSLVESFG
jgi:flagellar biosynthetic protein FliP